MTVRKLELEKPSPDPDVVAYLEEALAMAKAGNMRGVVITGDLVGNEVFRATSFQDGLRLVGHLQLQLFAMLRAME